MLSDLLRAVRLTGAVYFRFELSSPWAVEAPPACDIVGTVMPGSQRLFEYHLLARGTGWAHAVGGPPVRLREGDLVLFPHGEPHVLCSEPGLRAPPDMSAFGRLAETLPLVFQLGGGGEERARVVCCFMGCDDRPFNPLLAALPSMIHVSRDDAAAGWLGSLMEMASMESAAARAGGENVLARLSELMFVEAVRRHLETLPASEKGWLAALRDPVAGAALSALHGRPREPWTVAGLARHVGVSRSILAERFGDVVGHPPMQYLALWRMQLASRLLAGGSPVASAADAVGYDSEAAFSRTFKKLVGQSPGAWRKGAR